MFLREQVAVEGLQDEVADVPGLTREHEQQRGEKGDPGRQPATAQGADTGDTHDHCHPSRRKQELDVPVGAALGDVD